MSCLTVAISLAAILLTTVTSATQSQPSDATYKDYSTGPYSSQANAAQAADYGIGNRQGALLGGPIGMFLPFIFLLGLGALIFIPLMFLFISPLTMGYGGNVGYGRKRSITEDFMSKSNLLDLVGQFSQAIEKYSSYLGDKPGKGKP
ncbi:hypothetical protein HDE_00826 [Halotydeus destructor]|nr:hypothetical protein HDE_00826 [Halotydeus destructor]